MRKCRWCKGPIEKTRPNCNYCYYCDKHRHSRQSKEISNMQEHWIIKHKPKERDGVPTSVGSSESNNCYLTEKAAIDKAVHLSRNGQEHGVYKLVARIGLERPVPVKLPITRAADTRYSCKSNNCEDTECQRCFPTS